MLTWLTMYIVKRWWAWLLQKCEWSSLLIECTVRGYIKLSIEVLPLKLETSLICTHERETRWLVLQSQRWIMYVILSKSDHIWIEAEISKHTSEWMSEWLLFNAKRTICQPYHGGNTLYFNEMTIMSALYWINMLSWHFIVLSLSLSLLFCLVEICHT